MKVTNESIKMPITATSVKEKSTLRQSLAELNDETINSNRDRLVLSKDIISSAKNIKSSVKAEYDTKQLTPKPSITSEEISAEIQRLRLREKRPIANSEDDQAENVDQSVPNGDTVDKSSDISVSVKPSSNTEMAKMLSEQRNQISEFLSKNASILSDDITKQLETIYKLLSEQEENESDQFSENLQKEINKLSDIIDTKKPNSEKTISKMLEEQRDRLNSLIS